jgi:hypothetical protein
MNLQNLIFVNIPLIHAHKKRVFVANIVNVWPVSNLHRIRRVEPGTLHANLHERAQLESPARELSKTPIIASCEVIYNTGCDMSDQMGDCDGRHRRQARSSLQPAAPLQPRRLSQQPTAPTASQKQSIKSGPHIICWCLLDLFDVEITPGHMAGILDFAAPRSVLDFAPPTSWRCSFLVLRLR